MHLQAIYRLSGRTGLLLPIKDTIAFQILNLNALSALHIEQYYPGPAALCNTISEIYRGMTGNIHEGNHIKMKWMEVKVVFRTENKNWAIDVITGVFLDFGLQGVVIEGPEIEPADGFLGDDFVGPSADSVTGYLPVVGEFENRMGLLENAIRKRAAAEGIDIKLIYNEIDDEDWAESWKEYFHPRKVGRTIVVKPTWRDYESKAGEKVVEIDPGMAFGTGTHATTALCIEMLEKYLNPGDTLLDIGVGSGILMAVAAKLGASGMLGVDRDPVAVETARANLNLNFVDPSTCSVVLGNLVDSVNNQFDIAVANILTNTILTLLPDVRHKIRPAGGVLICSGIIEKNSDQIIEAMKKNCFEIIEVTHREEWVAIVGKQNVSDCDGKAWRPI